MICESEDEVEEITIRQIVDMSKKLVDMTKELASMETTVNNTKRKMKILTTDLDIVHKCREIDGGVMTASQKEFIHHSLIPLAKSLDTVKLDQLFNTLDFGIGMDSKLSHTVHHPGTTSFYH